MYSMQNVLNALHCSCVAHPVVVVPGDVVGGGVIPSHGLVTVFPFDRTSQKQASWQEHSVPAPQHEPHAKVYGCPFGRNPENLHVPEASQMPSFLHWPVCCSPGPTLQPRKHCWGVGAGGHVSVVDVEVEVEVVVGAVVEVVVDVVGAGVGSVVSQLRYAIVGLPAPNFFEYVQRHKSSLQLHSFPVEHEPERQLMEFVATDPSS